MKKKKTQTRQLRYVDGQLQVVGDKQEEKQVEKARIPKKNIKNVKNLAFFVFFLSFIVVMPFFFEKYELYVPHQTQAQTTFLKVWHIDSFEGGSGNRANFLEKVAQDYHKINPNIFIIVQNLSEEQAINALSKDDKPDLISFSHHINESVVEKLLPLDVDKNARSELLKCAEKEGRTYAVPWYMAGYCIIGNGEVDERLIKNFSLESVYSYDKGQSLFVAGMKNSFSLIALSENTKAKCDLTKCDKLLMEKTPYQAYCDFVENKSSVLLGTTRDVHRILNRINLGTMQNIEFLPLGNFTDLVQYVGVLSEKKQLVAESFINFLTSNETQKALKNIGLFSPNKLNLYNGGILKDMEEKLNQKLQSFSLFQSTDEKTKQLQNAIKQMY